MQIKLKGVVLRKTAISDHDAYLHVFTEDRGVVSVLARGIGRGKSGMSAAAQSLSLCEFTLFAGRDRYIANAIDLVEPFVELRSNLSGLSLAAYFGEIVSRLFDEGTDSGQAFRLFLNCLFLLSKKALPERQIKSIFELRVCALAGFAPDLSACRLCGSGSAQPMYFDVQEGTLQCGACGGAGLLVNPSVLAAMRHIVYAPGEKLFRFTLSPPSDRQLYSVTEQYLMLKSEKVYPSLNFYRSVADESI